MTEKVVLFRRPTESGEQADATKGSPPTHDSCSDCASNASAKLPVWQDPLPDEAQKPRPFSSSPSARFPSWTYSSSSILLDKK